MKNNNKKIKISIEFLIIFNVCILLIFIFSYIIFESTLSGTFKKIYIALTGFIIISALFYILYLSVKIKKENNKYISALSELYEYSHNLYKNSIDLYSSSLSFLQKIFPEETERCEEIKKKFSYIKIPEKNELFNKIKALKNFIQTYCDDIKTNLIFNAAEKSAKPDEKYEVPKKIILLSNYHSEIIHSFILSIITNLNKVSEPLSSRVLEIKSKLNEFLENISAWSSKFTDSKSDKNFNNIMKIYDKQSTEFTNTFEKIDDTYQLLNKSLIEIEIIDKQICQNMELIKEISEKIRILSINASIESARASEYGKGFKIVTNEVKKLSGETENAVKNIQPITEKANDIILKTLESFDKNHQEIINKIQVQQNDFNAFYQMLNNYYNELTNVFSTTSEVIKQIYSLIDNFVPIFHESNLITQQLENLNKIVFDFFEVYSKEINIILESVPENEKNKIAEEYINSIIAKVTTEEELAAIYAISKKLKINKNIKHEKKDAKIELF